MMGNTLIKRAKVAVMSMAMGGMPLVTAGSCDPYLSSLSFFRGDDTYYYTPSYAADVYYDDYYYDDWYYDGGYYEVVGGAHPT
jgi:hypothetical protein